MGVLTASCFPGALPTEVSIPTNTITPIGFTVNPTSTSGPAATETPFPPSPTLSYPVQGRGPTGFASNVDPLTGLEVADPTLLNRRTVAIKIENLPRGDRPQWGLTNGILSMSITEEGVPHAHCGILRAKFE